MKEQKSKPVDRIFPIQSAMRYIGICPLCSKPIKMDDFKDELSIREYYISGCCQKCQDDIFK